MTDLDRLRDTGHLVMTTTVGDTTDEWVSMQDYLDREAEFFTYRKALAMINAYHWQGDLGGKIRSVLNRLGFDGAQARAMNDLIRQVEDGTLR